MRRAEREAMLDAFAATGLGGTAMRLFLMILDGPPGGVEIDAARIGRRLGFGRQNLYNALNAMVARGIIERASKQRSVTYRLVNPPSWAETFLVASTDGNR